MSDQSNTSASDTQHARFAPQRAPMEATSHDPKSKPRADRQFPQNRNLNDRARGTHVNRRNPETGFPPSQQNAFTGYRSGPAPTNASTIASTPLSVPYDMGTVDQDRPMYSRYQLLAIYREMCNDDIVDGAHPEPPTHVFAYPKSELVPENDEIFSDTPLHPVIYTPDPRPAPVPTKPTRQTKPTKHDEDGAQDQLPEQSDATQGGETATVQSHNALSAFSPDMMNHQQQQQSPYPVPSPFLGQEFSFDEFPALNAHAGFGMQPTSLQQHGSGTSQTAAGQNKPPQQQLNHPLLPQNRMYQYPSTTPVWYYIDAQGIEQGPFTAVDMTTWFFAGYVHQYLHIKANPQGQYHRLVDWWMTGNPAFLPEIPQMFLEQMGMIPVAHHQQHQHHHGMYGFPLSIQQQQQQQAMQQGGRNIDDGQDENNVNQQNDDGSVNHPHMFPYQQAFQHPMSPAAQQNSAQMFAPNPYWSSHHGMMPLPNPTGDGMVPPHMMWGNAMMAPQVPDMMGNRDPSGFRSQQQQQTSVDSSVVSMMESGMNSMDLQSSTTNNNDGHAAATVNATADDTSLHDSTQQHDPKQVNIVYHQQYPDNDVDGEEDDDDDRFGYTTPSHYEEESGMISRRDEQSRPQQQTPMYTPAPITKPAWGAIQTVQPIPFGDIQKQQAVEQKLENQRLQEMLAKQQEEEMKKLQSAQSSSQRGHVEHVQHNRVSLDESGHSQQPKTVSPAKPAWGAVATSSQPPLTFAPSPEKTQRKIVEPKKAPSGMWAQAVVSGAATAPAPAWGGVAVPAGAATPTRVGPAASANTPITVRAGDSGSKVGDKTVLQTASITGKAAHIMNASSQPQNAWAASPNGLADSIQQANASAPQATVAQGASTTTAQKSTQSSTAPQSAAASAPPTTAVTPSFKWDMSPDFIRWCSEELSRLSAGIDIDGLSFVTEMEDIQLIRELIADMTGDNTFAADFIRYRSFDIKNQQAPKRQQQAAASTAPKQGVFTSSKTLFTSDVFNTPVKQQQQSTNSGKKKNKKKR